MWTCQQCGEKIEDQFGACWKCAGQVAPAEKEKPSPPQCLRCHQELDYLGTKQFYEGGHLAHLMGDLFVNRESFDVYVCPKCGHIDFFAGDIGEVVTPR